MPTLARPRIAAFAWCALLAAFSGARLSGQEAAPPAAETYLLRYQFQVGQSLRWQVEHQALIRTTVAGTTQTAETTTRSIKVWRIVSVDEQGQATFENSVESVDMRSRLTGREEVHYNSETDEQAPVGYEQAAAAVGVPLASITLDPRGQVVQREELHQQQSETAGQLTVPLPEEEVAVGGTWTFPYDVTVPRQNGAGVARIKTRQRFTLEEVRGPIAVIRIETQVLTPVDDPQIEVQLIQREAAGIVHLDMQSGRIVWLQTELDRNVVGFQGETSSLHYVMRVTEKILPDAEATARVPEDAGSSAEAPPPADAAAEEAAPTETPRDPANTIPDAPAAVEQPAEAEAAQPAESATVEPAAAAPQQPAAAAEQPQPPRRPARPSQGRRRSSGGSRAR